jgi:hypothetical protein
LHDYVPTPFDLSFFYNLDINTSLSTLILILFVSQDEDDESEDSSEDRVRGVVDLESMDLSKMVGAAGQENAELVDQIRNYQTQLRMVRHKEKEKERVKTKRKKKGRLGSGVDWGG